MTNAAKREIPLDDQSRVAVMGGGPAGSLFACFILEFAERVGVELEVDIFEPRDFSRIGPGGCNMCGGIVSESLVLNFAMEGINLPDSVVQRGIDSYVMHTEAGTCRIETPTHERRIAAVHRGGGPRTARESRWASFDGHLMELAKTRGAKVVPTRVTGLTWNGGKPEVRTTNGPPQAYDLLVGAVGVNSAELKLFESLGFQYQRPRVVRTFITELALGADTVKQQFGSSMHVFLLNLPRLDFAAFIPKGDFVTLCLLGTDIDKELVASFFDHPAVRECFPAGWSLPKDYCHCSPKMYFGEARRPFTDRVVLIGDCGASRLYKDGIGAAFRTARAAARAAVFEGVSADGFAREYLREYRRLTRDNLFGRVTFSVVHLIKHLQFSAAAVLRMVDRESSKPGDKRRMSAVLWDVFTGSSSYQNIFYRTLNPLFLLGFLGSMIGPGRSRG